MGSQCEVHVPDALRLDDQLCFALYAASNAVVRSYRSRLAAIGLTYPQYLVLMVLWEHGALPVGEVARRLELDSHAVSPLVARLVARGLVARRAGSDRRLRLVGPTAAGRALEDRASRVQRDVRCDTGLDPADLADLRARLRTLSDRLAHAGVPHDPTSLQTAGRTTTTEGEAP